MHKHDKKGHENTLLRLQKLHDMLMEIQNNTWKPTLQHPEFNWVKIGCPVEFNMEHWGTIGECGFMACAFGHAIMDERFIELRNWWKNCGSRIEATMYFFGIDRFQAERIFIPWTPYKLSNMEPVEVAEKVKQVMREYEHDYNRHSNTPDS